MANIRAATRPLLSRRTKARNSSALKSSRIGNAAGIRPSPSRWRTESRIAGLGNPLQSVRASARRYETASGRDSLVSFTFNAFPCRSASKPMPLHSQEGARHSRQAQDHASGLSAHNRDRCAIHVGFERGMIWVYFIEHDSVSCIMRHKYFENRRSCLMRQAAEPVLGKTAQELFAYTFRKLDCRDNRQITHWLAPSLYVRNPAGDFLAQFHDGADRADHDDQIDDPARAVEA